jgi:hypothetical protein
VPYFPSLEVGHLFSFSPLKTQQIWIKPHRGCAKTTDCML